MHEKATRSGSNTRSDDCRYRKAWARRPESRRRAHLTVSKRGRSMRWTRWNSADSRS